MYRRIGSRSGGTSHKGNWDAMIVNGRRRATPARIRRDASVLHVVLRLKAKRTNSNRRVPGKASTTCPPAAGPTSSCTPAPWPERNPHPPWPVGPSSRKQGPDCDRLQRVSDRGESPPCSRRWPCRNRPSAVGQHVVVCLCVLRREANRPREISMALSHSPFFW